MLNFIIIVVLVGVLMWAVNAYIPMESRIKTFLNIAVVILLVLWFLSLIGIFSGSLNAPIIQLR